MTIVISGIQNPERQQLRTRVKEMGGSYRPDWDDQGTPVPLVSHHIILYPFYLMYSLFCITFSVTQ